MAQRRTIKGNFAAFRSTVGVLQFIAGGGDGGTHRITGCARSAKPVMSPEYGAIYHDFDGMKLPDGGRVPLDYRHNEDEVLGFADGFEADAEGLQMSGQLMPSPDGNDRASEVIRLSAGGTGVPFQLSIDFRADDLVAEQLDEGETAEVNGQTVTGPALIFREWPLRGVAVCPYGKDRNTSAQFNQGGDEITARILSEGSMVKGKKSAGSGRTKPAAPAKGRQFTAGRAKGGKFVPRSTKGRQMADEKPADEQQAEEEEQQEEDDEAEEVVDGEQDDTVTDPEADPDAVEEETLEDEEEQQEEDEQPEQQQSQKAGLAKFVKAFGEKHGCRYFLKGMTFSQATVEENKRLRKALQTTGRQLTVAKGKLEQLGQDGEAEPLSMGNDEGDDDATDRKGSVPGGQYSATIGRKLGSFAESIVLPK